MSRLDLLAARLRKFRERSMDAGMPVPDIACVDEARMEIDALISPEPPGAIPFRMRHELKVWPEFLPALRDGRAPFTVRRDDRDFQPGDLLLLRAWSPERRRYTGQEVSRRVTYALRGELAEALGLKPGFVVLGLAAVEVAP